MISNLFCSVVGIVNSEHVEGSGEQLKNLLQAILVTAFSHLQETDISFDFSDISPNGKT